MNNKKQNVMKKYPLVMIEWKDAQSDCEWGEPEKVKAWASKDFIIHEIGWLVCETETHIVISNQIGEDGDFGNRTKIPKQWVTSKNDIGIRMLKKKK